MTGSNPIFEFDNVFFLVRLQVSARVARRGKCARTKPSCTRHPGLLTPLADAENIMNLDVQAHPYPY
jgi:hypothetical protein